MQIMSNGSGKFGFAVCPKCGASLQINYNDNWPGFHDSEDVLCPSCETLVTTIRTSGTPTVKTIKK
jgi:uncharacterized Zn finger protein (UPF0148 family)